MKQRDLELLSAYLDGQLSSSDSARLEARLRTDPALRSVLNDLRGARSLLRQLPMRKAPRNFTLTPKMVGKNPPLPRSYPVFRFSATLATILLFFTFGLNLMGRQLAFQPYPGGMGGGGAPDTFAESAPATEAPATKAAAAEAPAGEPSISMVPMPTATVPLDDTARVLGTPVTKQGDAENGVGGGLEQQPPAAAAEPAAVQPIQPVSPVLQWILVGIALISVFIMAMMRQLSINRWRRKS